MTTMFFPKLSHNALPNVRTIHLQYDQNDDIYSLQKKKNSFIYKDTINIIKVLSYQLSVCIQLSVSILLHTYLYNKMVPLTCHVGKKNYQNNIWYLRNH